MINDLSFFNLTLYSIFLSYLTYLKEKMEGKANVDYRTMAKKYISYSSVELKQKLLDKKGSDWIKQHWGPLNKERADIMRRPPAELKELVA